MISQQPSILLIHHGSRHGSAVYSCNFLLVCRLHSVAVGWSAPPRGILHCQISPFVEQLHYMRHMNVLPWQSCPLFAHRLYFETVCTLLLRTRRWRLPGLSALESAIADNCFIARRHCRGVDSVLKLPHPPSYFQSCWLNCTISLLHRPSCRSFGYDARPYWLSDSGPIRC